MTTVKWDAELAYIAKMNVRVCSHHRDACRNTDKHKNVGQTTAYGGVKGKNRTPKEFIKRHFKAWFAQWKLATMKDILRYDSKEDIPPHNFLQIVHDKVQKIGCASLKQSKNGWIQNFFTCNYDEAPIKGQAVYKTGHPGAQCVSGRDQHFKSLCNVVDKNAVDMVEPEAPNNQTQKPQVDAENKPANHTQKPQVDAENKPANHTQKPQVDAQNKPDNHTQIPPIDAQNKPDNQTQNPQVDAPNKPDNQTQIPPIDAPNKPDNQTQIPPIDAQNKPDSQTQNPQADAENKLDNQAPKILSRTIVSTNGAIEIINLKPGITPVENVERNLKIQRAIEKEAKEWRKRFLRFLAEIENTEKKTNIRKIQIFTWNHQVDISFKRPEEDE
uniref:SCP domain-containing protein n=1 Tax=Drosophila mojavensis TaxID=7230 RepID=A0A0B4UD75_DROMO|nr:hypothetical protein [Drosophila mojavensis]